MTEFDREAIASIREITLQLVLLAAGILTIGTGFLTTQKQIPQPRWLISTALVSMVLSILLGVLTYGAIISQLGSNVFDSKGQPLTGLAMAQWILFILGIVLLAVYAVAFAVRDRSSSESRR